MHSDGYTDDVCNEHQIFVAVRHVGTVLPLEDQPEHQRRAERGECVDLTLDSREPESIAPGVHERAADARSENREHFHRADRSGVVAHDQPADKVSYCPEQEQYRTGAQQSRHDIDA